MKPGKYVVKVTDCGMMPDGKGNPAPYAIFENEAGETITWRGYLGHEKSEEFAVKSALTMGFTGKDWDDFTLGIKNLDGRQVAITVEAEEHNGKTYHKVKWINEVKEMKSLKSADLKGVSSKGLFASMKSQVRKVERKPEVGF